MSGILPVSGPWQPTPACLVVWPDTGVMLVPLFDPTDPVQIVAASHLTRLIGSWN